jgi:hypothetical protein
VIRSCPYRFSRRKALAGIAASMVRRLGFSDTVPVHAPAESYSGPDFSSGGPDTELYGAGEGFPTGTEYGRTPIRHLLHIYGYLLWPLRCANASSHSSATTVSASVSIQHPKLVLVPTSVEEKTEIWRLWSALVKQFGHA